MEGKSTSEHQSALGLGGGPTTKIKGFSRRAQPSRPCESTTPLRNTSVDSEGLVLKMNVGSYNTSGV